MKSVYAGASVIALMAAFASQASAQEAAVSTDAVDAVIVTGTRTTGLRAVDSPAPVQVLGDDLLRRVGQPNLVQALAQNMPSIQAQAFGSDTAAFNLSMKLRGLSPNHTLVLINGKRRHGMANVAVSGGPYGGNAAADVSLIPVNSIDHIEVLQEGAAAQYGTDAIAGVVNIFLKKNSSGGTISATGGEYMDGGGKTGEVSAGIAVEPFENAYLDMTIATRYRGFSFRGDFDPRVYPAPGNDPAFNTQRANANRLLAEFPQVVNFPGYPYVNTIRGDAEFRQTSFIFNAGYDFNDNLQVYGFGTYNYRWGQAIENYRLPNVVLGRGVSASTTPATLRTGDIPFPAGFLPKQNLIQDEYSITGGIKGAYGAWNWDISTTYGHDKNKINVIRSGNATLYADKSTTTTAGFTPNDFHNGDFELSQWTNTLDVSREFDVGFPKPLTFAAGLEYREDSYAIIPGDPASYYGTGAQSFFGYAPVNAGKYTRNNKAGYLDIAFNPVEMLAIDAAVRYEDYSDFGDTTVFKLTGRYDFNDMFAIRGTASTGFRAPTLGEGFYSGINVGPTSVSGVFAPNSPGAAFLGIAGLGPEKSRNFSAGVVTHFLPRLTITLDAYSITIKDRILQSGTLSGYNSNPAVVRSPSVIQALMANGVSIDPNIFTAPSGSVGVVAFVNGLDTITQGADLVATYATNFGDYGRVDWSLATNYNSTRITKIAPPPSNVAQTVQLFDVPARSNLKSTTPQWRATFGALWTLGKMSVNLRESFYGPSFNYLQKPVGSGFDQIKINEKLITDVELSYQVLEPVRLAIGANNLFNEYPTKTPKSYRDAQLSTTSNGYASSLYPDFSPIGINGGFYYGRVTVTF